MNNSTKLLFLVFSILFIIETNSFAQISRIDPEQPLWNQTLTIIYDTASPGAKFTLEDDIYVYARLSFPGDAEHFSSRMVKDGNRFKCRFDVRANLSAAGFHFITLNGGWDEGAYTTAIFYRDDGRPARGAFEGKIGSQRYLEFFKQETDLYPDNYSAYRAKWSTAFAFEGQKAVGMINSDMRKLSGGRSETAELLSALSYGHLLQGREDKCIELIQRLFVRYPDSNYMALAIGDYELDYANRGSPVNISNEVMRTKLAIIRQFPGSEFARTASTAMSRDQRASLPLIEAIAQQWMKKEPDNPQGYFNLAQAYKNQYQKYDQATPLIEKAIGLLNEGKLRLYGDVNGKRTNEMLYEAYLTGAELAFRQTKFDKAIVAVKAAQLFEQETGGASHLLEAKVWLALTQETKAEAAFIEAWRRGSRDAEERLKERYKNRTGDLQGFDEYLLAANKDSKTNSINAITRRPSPQFKVTSLDGKTFDLDALQGKIVVLNLWFIGCGPCRKEIPKLNRLVAEFRDKNIVFLAPTFDGIEELKNFLKTMPFNYTIVPNAEELIVGKFNAATFPTHIVIDQDGQIDQMFVGGGERRPEEVRRVLLRLLK